MFVDVEGLANNAIRLYDRQQKESDKFISGVSSVGEGDAFTFHFSDDAPPVLFVSRFYSDYKIPRKKEYPPIGDQLDALWKLIKANADKIDLAEAAPLLEAVQAVKDKHPKPPTNDIN